MNTAMFTEKQAILFMSKFAQILGSKGYLHLNEFLSTHKVINGTKVSVILGDMTACRAVYAGPAPHGAWFNMDNVGQIVEPILVKAPK